MPNNEPRRHHYTPVLLLKRFTDSDGLLHLVSRQKGHRFSAKPNAVGFENDFYTLEDGEDVEDRYAVEKAFAEFEGEAAAVLDEVIASGTIPDEAKKFNTLMNFIALSAARIPAMRAVITKPIEEIAETILHMNLSSEEQFKYSFKQAGIDVDAIGLTYEKAKETAAGLTIRTTTAAYIHHLNKVVSIMLPLLADRHWCVLHNDGANGNLIVTDNPVGITWSDGHRPGNLFDTPAFGRTQTDVSIPIGSRIALLGRFEPLPGRKEMEALGVASMNTKTLAGCQRFIGGAAEDFTCLNDSGAIVTDKEVVEHLKKLAAERA
jgi:hypothetical protein